MRPSREVREPPIRSVLHILAPGDVGGLESVVRSLVLGQASLGYRVAVLPVLDSNRADHPFLTPLREAGIEVHPCVVPARAYLREQDRVRTVCTAVAPDLVHTHGYRADVLASATARRLGLPTVTTVHGFTGGDPRNRFYEWLQRRSYRRFAAVVAVSKPLREELARSGVSARRLHVVPNAWAPTRPPLDRRTARAQLGVPAEGFRLGWVGRLSHEKGPDLLVEAMRCLIDLPVRASVVGAGREGERLRQLAKDRAVTDRIDWHGIIPDAGRLFRAFDCLVLSSRTEGTPIVLFEAMATNVPIVATAVGGVPDVLGPSEAMLVPPNDPAALARAVRSVYDQVDAAAQRAGEAARRLVADFGLEPWLRRYDAIYEAVTMPRDPQPSP
jgi:glycosyltransferase involved in cell wall biosynthesis